MGKIRYGIIGAGNQGTNYAHKIFDSGKAIDAELVAVCDKNPAKIEALKAKLENVKPLWFDDYKKMLDANICDVILVETPHYDHPEMVIECLGRGVNVICDKPAGVYAKHVKQMNAAAEKSNAKFAMMFNQRTNCLYRKMRELILSGEIGQIQRVIWVITDWFRTQQYYDSGSWRATWA